MVYMGLRLKRLGYARVSFPTFGYHMRPIAENGRILAHQLASEGEYDVVTFSFGGLLLRAASAAGAPSPRRVVMLSPPHQGARLAEQVRATLPVHHWGWDPLSELLPGALCHLPVVPGEVGILTGGNGASGFRSSLGDDNDGKVRVAEAHLPEVRAFRVIPHRHFEMPYAPTSVIETAHFLEHGRFTTARAPA